MNAFMSRPDSPRSIDAYRRLAARYDVTSRRGGAVRRQAVALLELQPGEVVLDAGSGTGLSFAPLIEAIGPAGRLIAIEHSPEMMRLARQRVDAAGWKNVTLIESAAESADIPCAFDAVLFHYTHDVLQSRAALTHLLARARPGARVAVAGAKFAPWWLAPLNLWVLIRARPYLTTYAGLARPWRYLEPHLRDLQIRLRLLGTAYLACGRVGVNPGSGEGGPLRPA